MNRRRSLFAAFGAMVCALAVHAADVAPSLIELEKQRIDVIAKATPTFVAIFANEGNGGGSGVLISADGYALSNYHVTRPAGDHMKCGLADGKMYDAVIVGVDPTGDVALIKLLGRNDFPFSSLANSDLVRQGDWCFAVGNPFLLATDLQPTVTCGLVSGTHRYQYPSGTLIEYADCIQTDAAINPGNSGGPLFNDQGEVIGINGRISIDKRGRVNVGVGYAISINQIKYFLGCLHSGRIVDHATLGATVATADDGRVVVTNILESSDAFRRGLRYGDEVVAFGGRTVTTTNEFKNVLGIYPKGWHVPLVYKREGKRHEILVRLAGVHGEEELIRLVQQGFGDEEEPSPPEESEKPEPKNRNPGQSPEDKKEESDKPEKSKKPGKPQPEKPGRPRRPGRPPGSAHQDKAPVPEAVAKLIEPRTGYANFYFNRLHQNRIWSAATKEADYASLTGPWTLTGELTGGGKVQVTLADDRSIGEFPSGTVKLDASNDFDAQLLPVGTGGLLPALHLWRKMLIAGPEKFGNVSYYGTTPWPAQQGEMEVLHGLTNVVETNFVFAPQSSRLVAVEMLGEPDADGCELRLSEYREHEGRLFPFRMQAWHGDLRVGDIQWKDVQLQSAEETK
jgi:S1-C subfamily serine protease